MTFGEYVLEGMRASGWLIGMVAALSLFAIGVGILILGCKVLAEHMEDKEGDNNGNSQD